MRHSSSIRSKDRSSLYHTPAYWLPSLTRAVSPRPYDLETDKRVAEFKFTAWRSGPESIRQNQLFKDLSYLVSRPTTKRRYLYVVGKARPMHFFEHGRALASVLSKDAATETRAPRRQFGLPGRLRKLRSLFSDLGPSQAIPSSPLPETLHVAAHRVLRNVPGQAVVPMTPMVWWSPGTPLWTNRCNG